MAKQWHQLERLDHRSLKKLQQEREKAAKEAQVVAERKKIAIISGISVFVILCIIIVLLMVRRKIARQNFMEERLKLFKASVSEVVDPAFTRSLGDWKPLTNDFTFSDDQYFKTEKDGFISLKLQLENLVKIFQDSEMQVHKNILKDEANEIVKQLVTLQHGELTIAVSKEGRDLLETNSGGVIARGASGLYKVIYDKQKDSGEVVVKNGLVEVFGESNPSRRVKVSGFYKVTFQGGTIADPTQVSVIQYDWR